MRPITTITLCALAAAALAAPAFAASDFYLKLGPVKGEELDERKGRENKIEILSSEFGTARKGWDGTIKGGREASSGMASGKRQHGWIKVSTPLDQGSVRVKVRFPWVGCAVGGSFPDAMLLGDAGSYKLSDVTVTDCASDSITLNYTKVVVRAWDPSTKKE